MMCKSNTWMATDLFKHLFFDRFVTEIKVNFKKCGKPEDSRELLSLDNCSIHISTSDLVCGNIIDTFHQMSLPSVTIHRLAIQIQPMDQSVIQNIKCFYRRFCVQGPLNSNCDVKDFKDSFMSEIDGQNMVLDLVENVPNNPFTCEGVVWHDAALRKLQIGLKSTEIC
ncbi:hypothetical protein CEXT_21311 [Caerostris extrusa]|uniref:DDE-1 domain-containing protein n=1 Tax=Caerostris extrusa TaxID=172846 RepID=A0AAV4QEK1_CAEEX|nr:hypothetical protein CEXT_21311 [Caerostris extrusa]